MRHRRRNKRFNRTPAHRLADGRNMVADLFLHGRVITTLPKAKEYRRLAEKLITMGKKKSLHSYRRAISILQDKEAAKKLFEEIAPQYQERPGGYTRVLRLSGNRLGDNAPRAVFELVDYAEVTATETVEEAPKKRGLFGLRKGARSEGGAEAEKAPRKKATRKKTTKKTTKKKEGADE